MARPTMPKATRRCPTRALGPRNTHPTPDENQRPGSIPKKLAHVAIAADAPTGTRQTRSGIAVVDWYLILHGCALAWLCTTLYGQFFVSIKTEQEISGIRHACRLAAEILEKISPHVVPGVSTRFLDDEIGKIIEELGGVAAPLHYGTLLGLAHGLKLPADFCAVAHGVVDGARSLMQAAGLGRSIGLPICGFPAKSCVSINEVVCHGIPSERVLKVGDIVNLDVTIIKAGYHGDSSVTFVLGDAEPSTRRLVDAARQALYLGIRQVRPGVQLGAVGHAIEKFAKVSNFSVVREYGGHGIGVKFHESPHVAHYGDSADSGMWLKRGMVFTIEPMLNEGGADVECLSDQWTVVTVDRKLSAQFEHTVLVTDDGVEVLTQRVDEAGLKLLTSH